MAGGLVDERQGEGVTLVEWAERMADVMPAAHLDVLIEGTGDEPRTITVRAGSAEYERYLEALAETAEEAAAE